MPEGAEIQVVYCRHCGKEWQTESPESNWLCEACDHYQDATICPTCGGLARISALPADLQPAAHKPVKAKE